MIKRLIVFLLFLFPWFSNPGLCAGTGSDVLLQLPVRVYSTDGNGNVGDYSTALKQEHITLFVNNQPRAITGFIAKKESMGAMVNPATERFIALSFETGSFDVSFIEGVTAFIRLHITPHDHLVIRTPLDIYTINTTPDTTQMIENIRTILENDLHQQQRDKMEALQQLNLLLQGITLRLGKKHVGIRAATLFAAHFLEGWRHYYQTYLLANLESFATFTARFAAGKGEKYAIHFQERDILPLMKSFQNIASQLQTYALSLAKKSPQESKVLTDTLDKIARSMLFSGEFPMDELLDALLGVNIHCHVIFLENLTNQGETDLSSSVSAGYEKILAYIAQQTGGITTYAGEKTGLTDALKRVTDHTDYYYEIIYAFDGQEEDQNILVSVSPGLSGAVLYYKKRFRKEEFTWLRTRPDTQELVISGVTLAGHQLTFRATGYKKGALDVSVGLLDSTATVVYETHKTLHAEETSLTISLILPSQFQGYYKLTITAQDKVGNQKGTASQYVRL